jgi:hypothetical protein
MPRRKRLNWLKKTFYLLVASLTALTGCSGGGKDRVRIVFLHHSTGKAVWDGGVKDWVKRYNRENGTGYDIKEVAFPKESPYGWNNYPFDYWNIWVRHAGPEPFMDEPTLEMLTKKYDVIIWKHCFPVSEILPDTGSPDVASSEKRAENYRLQYEELGKKMREFPDTKFIVWTGAALVRARTDEEQATRARDFFRWVVDEWDEPGDNIFVWDFRGLETGGGLYMKPEFARSETDSHPNEEFASKTAPQFGRMIVEVIEGRADEAGE